MRLAVLCLVVLSSLSLVGCDEEAPFADPSVASKHPAEYARAEAQVVAASERNVAIGLCVMGAAALALLIGLIRLKGNCNDVPGAVCTIAGAFTLLMALAPTLANQSTANAPMQDAIKAMHGGTYRK